MRQVFSWDDARYFLAIERGHSLSSAARQLRVNQSTVGRRLEGLEAQLGARLFDRTPEGYVLTSAGEALLPHAQRIEEEVQAATLEIGGHESRLTGTVRVTAPGTFGARYLVPLLAGFCRVYPNIDVEVIADDRTLSLSRREADVSLRLTRATQPLLVIRKVAEVGSGPRLGDRGAFPIGRPLRLGAAAASSSNQGFPTGLRWPGGRPARPGTPSAWTKPLPRHPGLRPRPRRGAAPNPAGG